MVVIYLNKVRESRLEERVIGMLDNFSDSLLFDFLNLRIGTIPMELSYKEPKFDDSLVWDLKRCNDKNIYYIIANAYRVYRYNSFDLSLDLINKALKICKNNKHGLLMKMHLCLLNDNLGLTNIKDLDGAVKTALKNYPDNFNILFYSIIAYTSELQTKDNVKTAYKLISYLREKCPAARTINSYLLDLQNKMNFKGGKVCGRIHRRR